jgi:hypothetical protein
MGGGASSKEAPPLVETGEDVNPGGRPQNNEANIKRAKENTVNLA